MGFKHTPQVEQLYDKRNLSRRSRKLLYTRGFLISPKKYYVKHWAKIRFGGMYISIDKMNSYAIEASLDNSVLLIGTAMDTLNWHMDIHAICRTILQILDSSDEDDIYKNLYDYIDFLNGRYVIVYTFANEVRVVQDATGMRSCYFSEKWRGCASHYNLLVDVEYEDRNDYINTFVSLDPQPWFLPGNSTPYKNVYALSPNCELNLSTLKMKRIWPRHNKTNISVTDAIDYCIYSITNQMKTLSSNFKLMLSLTRGNDSRISLASCKQYMDNIIFFTSYDGDPEQLIDANFARDFCQKLGLQHIYIDAHEKKEKNLDYYKAAFINYYHSYMFSSIAQYKEKLPKNAIFLRSNLIEIVRENNYFCTLPANCSYVDLAKRIYHEQSSHEYVQKMYKKWFQDADVNNIYDYPIGEIIYWEYRMGLWLNPSALLRDDLIADTYMLFNCRKLLEALLSMPYYYKSKNVLVYEIINRLWPEIGYVIPNTDYTLKDYWSTFDTYVNHDTVKIISGNIFIEKEINTFFRKGRFSSEFGFGEKLIDRGDYIDFRMDLIITQIGVNCIQLSIHYDKGCDITSDSIAYEVFIDSEKVYELILNHAKLPSNQITIIKRFDSKKALTLAVRIIANADYQSTTKGCCGMLSVSNISIEHIKEDSALETKLIASENFLSENT